MIIDLNTRIWRSIDQLGPAVAERLRRRPVERWGELDGAPQAHERAMSCVDASVVLGFRSDRLGAHVPNEFVAEFVGRDPRRRLGFAGIDPLAADAMDQLDAAIDLGLVGVTVSPIAQGFHPAHSSAMRVYEKCVDHGLPVMVTAGTPLTSSCEMEFARPYLWDEVARDLPDLSLVISELGHPWPDETLALLEKHEHVWSDVSSIAARPWQLYGALLQASSLGVMEKILFGSGFPYQTPATTIESLYSVNAFAQGTQLPSVARALVRGIVERDAVSALGIDVVIQARDDSGLPDEAIAVSEPME